MRRGDILLVDLGQPAPVGGREQAGRRPAIAVLSDAAPATLPMTMVVPVTSQAAALRFPYTLKVDPSPANGLTVSSILLVFQLRALDISRVVEVKGHLEEPYMTQLDDMLRRMLGL